MRAFILILFIWFALNATVGLGNSIIDAMPFWMSATLAIVLMAAALVGLAKWLMFIGNKNRG